GRRVLGGGGALGEPIENPVLEIDERSSFSSAGRCAGDSPSPGPGIDARGKFGGLGLKAVHENQVTASQPNAATEAREQGKERSALVSRASNPHCLRPERG